MPSAVAKASLQKTVHSRIFTIEDRAGPNHPPIYQTLGRAQALSWPQGDVTPIRIPDPDSYEDFIEVDEIRGARGLPTLGLQFRKDRQLSDILKMVRKGCQFDVQVHVGACRQPSDFNEGWELITVLAGARATSYDTDELGALDSDQNAVVNESVSVTGLDLYEVKPVTAGEIAAAQVVQEVIAVAICDSKTCGACGLPSDGCQIVFGLTLSAGGSPGLPAEILFSDDGGATWDDTNITTLGANEDPNDFACVGNNLVVISEDDEALHYAAIADILEGIETWARVTSGIVATKGPLAIISLGRTFTWIVAEAGYIYFSDDVTSGVEVQSAGAATTEDLHDIHAWDVLNLVAVGDNNAVLHTTNGGSSWSLITGPAPAVNLNTVWMHTKETWFVGTAGGQLFYTEDSGDTWTEKAFPGSGAGQVRDIKFYDLAIGYMAHDTSASGTARGRILRTLDGGYSWYVAPEGTANMADNDRIVALAACEEDPNLVFGAGLGDNAVDGFMVKVA